MLVSGRPGTACNYKNGGRPPLDPLLAKEGKEGVVISSASGSM